MQQTTQTRRPLDPRFTGLLTLIPSVAFLVVLAVDAGESMGLAVEAPRTAAIVAYGVALLPAWFGCLFHAASRPHLGGLARAAWLLALMLFPVPVMMPLYWWRHLRHPAPHT